MDRDTGQPSPPGVSVHTPLNKKDDITKTPPRPLMSKIIPSPFGIENAKKRLRAFSIQKKTPLTPVPVQKTSGPSSSMVLIGKLSSVKPTPKRDEEPDSKVPKLPKPPKPGAVRKALQDVYSEQQRRTQVEIEDMKRKMELVDLGIPLGLICPSSISNKAMPTKAMPPIKSFIDPAKVDEIIREAKKAKMEGKQFKFDYQKLLPGYDNPFQTKKKGEPKDREKSKDESKEDTKDRKYDKRKDYRDKKDRYKHKRHSDYKKDERSKEHTRSKDKETERKSESKDTDKKDEKETAVNFGDYLVCDSWSLDNDDKTSTMSPKYEDKSDSQSSARESRAGPVPSEIRKASLEKRDEIIESIAAEKEKLKLQPVTESFKFEIDDNEEEDEDEVLDIFDAESDIEKFAKVKPKKSSLYSPDKKSIDIDDSSRDLSLDGMNDDTFLESVINEIKVEMSDEESQDKGLVEYDMSPIKDDTPNTSRDSITPELVPKDRKHNDYSDGYRSSESGYKTSDTVESYKNRSKFRLSLEKDLDQAVNANKMSKETVDSLETWTFVLKICQPLLFRHDRNKCCKETRTQPPLQYATNPKSCPCVKDRSVVYEELEMCKMSLVDRLYGCDQIAEEPPPTSRAWYPMGAWGRLQRSAEWEDDTSALTHNEELALDREYHRFMEAVYPDIADTTKEPSRSTTPVQENRKKRKEESESKEEKREDDKRAKKMKISSEGWSQESDVEEDDRSKKVKGEKEKNRKRKRSTSISSSTSDSEEDSKKRKKALKKKVMKKVKSKSAKRRRVGKKLLKKLKEKHKKNKKIKLKDLSEEDSESDVKSKKIKKKKVEKAKKKDRKKKKSKKSSSDSDSSSSSDSEREKKSKKKKDKSKKKRKKSSSESQNEDLFDVNILNNIKTEKTDDGQMEFSPRRQKPREIINVKELQNDFVGNTHIKEEVEEKSEEKEKETHIVEESLSPVPKSPDKIEEPIKDESQDFDAEIAEIYEIEEKQVPVEAPKTPEPIKPPVDDTSQCSSQESVYSTKENQYEKDESHLRPSSQNSNYSFKDVISSNQYKDAGSNLDCEYEHDYEMYEQMAMAYQSDVAKQSASELVAGGCAVSRIETVVGARCGEIKCDWRAGPEPAPRRPPARPSRWGMKPGEVNIVLTGGDPTPGNTSDQNVDIGNGQGVDQNPGQNSGQTDTQPVYRIQSLANRNDNTSMSYDEAYMDMYGASDRLQYGDCFGTDVEPAPSDHKSTLDDRINQALRETVLGDVAKEIDDTRQDGEKANVQSENGASASGKRVRFADGYAPGQDSDTEPPPKKRRARRVGCAWPCPSEHPDHVSLWDALPPPPPPPGDPPPRPRPPRRTEPLLGVAPPGFMPPEPPPGLIAIH